MGNWMREGHILPRSRGGLGFPCEPSTEEDTGAMIERYGELKDDV